MMHSQDRLRRIVWFTLDHLLTIILIIMIAAVIAVLFVDTRRGLFQSNVQLQNSVK